MSETNTREIKLPAAAAPSPASGAIRPVPAAGDENGSFGRALAAAREARGLSQSDVAAQLRLHVRQVQAIEAEDLAALPEGPFVRGYVRNFAKMVDLPAEPLLSLLNAKLKPTDPLHAQVGGSAVSPIQRTPREPLSGRIVIAGVLVLLALLAVFGWWSMRADEPKPAAAAAAPAPVTAQPAQPAAAEPAQATAAVGAASPPTDTTTATLPGVAASGAELRFHFRDRSWVEVREADGTVLMSQNNVAGATKTVEGKPPYLVVIGNASKVELAFRGQPVDVASAIGRDDIARLRLE